MAFETKIRRVRFATPGYTGAQMAGVGAGLVSRGIVPRIQAGRTVADSDAPPLAAGYAKVKARRAPPAVRNWTFSGRTLRSMKVLSAAPNRAVIGFTDAETNKRAAINNRRARQFGVSTADQRVLSAEFGKLPAPVRAIPV